jgi:DNA-binding NarL/FixJ family response regulator
METLRIRIAILENNQIILNDIISLLKNDPTLEVVRTFDDIKHCINEVSFCRPDVLLLDIGKRDIDNINDIKFLNGKYPHIQILVYTTQNDDRTILDVINAGASGYVLKNIPGSNLIIAIKELRNGGSPISAPIARRVLTMLQRGTHIKVFPSGDYNLTGREKQILHHLKNGLSYKMIAYDHGITYSTVRSHMQSIYKKLNVASLTELVSKAIRENI